MKNRCHFHVEVPITTKYKVKVDLLTSVSCANHNFKNIYLLTYYNKGW